MFNSLLVLDLSYDSVEFVIDCVHKICSVSRYRSGAMDVFAPSLLFLLDKILEFATELEQLANFKHILGILLLQS